MGAKKPLPPPAGPSLSRFVFLVLLCAAVGGAIVYWGSPKIRELLLGANARSLFQSPLHPAAAKPGKPATKDLSKAPALPPLPAPEGAATETGPDPAKTTKLERENKRLREELAGKERENADLKIQLKLLQDGSRAQDAR